MERRFHNVDIDRMRGGGDKGSRLRVQRKVESGIREAARVFTMMETDWIKMN